MATVIEKVLREAVGRQVKRGESYQPPRRAIAVPHILLPIGAGALTVSVHTGVVRRRTQEISMRFNHRSPYHWLAVAAIAIIALFTFGHARGQGNNAAAAPAAHAR
jgi:hypothetical protein